MQTLFVSLYYQTTQVRLLKNQSSMTNLIKAIEKIAKANPYGFTVDLTTLKKVKKGFVSAYLETQDSFGNEGLEKVLKHALENGNTIGGWLNEENNLYYYDSVKVFDNETECIKFGLANKQIAVFDIENLRVIKL